ncbi:GIY-YIG nuclease family protein [Streptomyces canus]
MPDSPEPDASVVYVIGEPDSLTVKIGVALNVKHRLAGIQRMSPVLLTTLWTHPGERRLEKRLHNHFREYRSHGEWFTFPEDPLPLIQGAIADEPWHRKPDGPRMPPSSSKAMDALRSHMHSIQDPQARYAAMMQLGEEFRAWEREQRQAIAVALHSEGRTWRDVGQIMGGVSYQRAHQYAYGSAVEGRVVRK